MNTGWLCPRCHAVNAPDVKQCACLPDVLSPFSPLADVFCCRRCGVLYNFSHICGTVSADAEV